MPNESSIRKIVRACVDDISAMHHFFDGMLAQGSVRRNSYGELDDDFRGHVVIRWDMGQQHDQEVKSYLSKDQFLAYKEVGKIKVMGPLEYLVDATMDPLERSIRDEGS